MALIGNTIRITAIFENPDVPGEYVDPTNITLKVYEDRTQTLIDEVSIDASYKVSAGIYKINYVVPDGERALVLEVKGYVNGFPIIGTKIEPRQRVKRY